MKYTYLVINILTILFPFLFSFERRVAFAARWKYLFPAMVTTATVFLVWDYFFTQWGVWGFNDTYITGAKILGLPIEEVFFFFTVPYSCLFIYDVMNYAFPSATKYSNVAGYAGKVLAVVLPVLAVLFYNRLYTSVNAVVCLALLFVFVKFYKQKAGTFFRFYLVHLIPFFIVNGILTGTGLTQPVVWYNNNHNLGIRLFTIPIEDTLYSMSMMFMNIMLYEYFQQRSVIKHQQPIHKTL